MGLFNAGIEASVGVMQVACIAAGGFLIMRGEMDLVDLLTFSLYIAAFLSPIRRLVQFTEIWAQGSAGFSRFLELMRTRPEITDAPDAKELTDVRGEVRLEHVCFRYREGFYDVTAGSVRIDGQDVREVTQESLRRNVGIIQQDVFLFAGTIMDNIRYGSPDADDRAVIEAAVRAEIHEDILRMPDGYDSFVGERGVVLSGGQKQRVAIARAFLKNPRILILDEATSALDSVTEQKIQHSLDELSRGKTCIVIAHRLATVRGADRIGVIEGGRLVEEGTREELLRRGGRYAALEHAQE